jgi:hypothetical protein
MGIPHRNNPPRAITGRPHNHNQPPAEIPGRHVPGFAIVLPVIPRCGARAGKNLAGISEIQPPMLQRRGAFGGIIADLHCFIVVTKIS